MFEVSLATPQDFPVILRLQQQNLAMALSGAEAAREGFVTVRHTQEILERMHALAPSLVARAGDELAGYALVMPVGCREIVPVLDPMFAAFERLSFRGRPLTAQRFYVMGQVCVAKAFRGQGVFDALYAGHAREYSASFDCVVTEIATANGRSLRAHQRVGFVEIARQRDAENDWSIVAWDLKSPG
jgi:GNAT superfamily N-acetyltransferase